MTESKLELLKTKLAKATPTAKRAIQRQIDRLARPAPPLVKRYHVAAYLTVKGVRGQVGRTLTAPSAAIAWDSFVRLNADHAPEKVSVKEVTQ